ncbi:MAG: YdcF family protein [Cyanosarcina radialis HA8281-LM2]|jgi:uncharacterized SAM-binding protein YcdF (DUF218 family)|nr:YdcF family protein [Cyanosarcina radialis HA8281-LM2]
MVGKIHPSRQRNRIRHRSLFARIRLIVWLSPLLIVSFWLSYRQTASFWLKPDCILVLGGEPEREKFAARFARQHPDLPIWVSGGSPKSYALRVFAKAGIDRDRLHLDYQAVDTLTNFTSLADELRGLGIQNVYLITSEDHMLRARTVGEIVFGSRGILIQPITMPTERSPEPLRKTLRDAGRAILWLTTGYPSKAIERSSNP